jgi:hypothetical protein
MMYKYILQYSEINASVLIPRYWAGGTVLYLKFTSASICMGFSTIQIIPSPDKILAVCVHIYEICTVS